MRIRRILSILPIYLCLLYRLMLATILMAFGFWLSPFQALLRLTRVTEELRQTLRETQPTVLKSYYGFPKIGT